MRVLENLDVFPPIVVGSVAVDPDELALDFLKMGCQFVHYDLVVCENQNLSIILKQGREVVFD